MLLHNSVLKYTWAKKTCVKEKKEEESDMNSMYLLTNAKTNFDAHVAACTHSRLCVVCVTAHAIFDIDKPLRRLTSCQTSTNT